jgi:hypothetical protein
MNEDVCVVKTSDGYELIGRVVKMRNDEVVRVMNPLEIRYRANALGMSTAVLVPYNSFGKEDFVDLFRTALVCIYKTTDDYAKTYDESLKSIEEQLKGKSRSTTVEVSEKLKAAIEVLTANNTVH